MSSSQPHSAQRRRRWSVRSWSLRARLLAGVMVLLAVVCVLIGGFTELALRNVLVRQLDNQLNQAAVATTGLLAGHGQHGGGAPPMAQLCPGSLPFPGLPPGSITAVSSPDGDYAQQLTGSCGTNMSTVDTMLLLAPPTVGQPYTLTVDGQDYRLLALVSPDGASTMVIGIPMAQRVTGVLMSLGVNLGVVTLIALVIAGIVGAVIVRRTLRPLRRVADTASRVAELELDRGDVALSVRVPDADTDPRTEVGQVGAALNRMLGHIGAALAARQASETRVRQFVADASHELRTPLAAIRGYAELARRGHDEVPPKIAHALRRVESESARMTTLVDDLLLLARLDSGRPLRAEPVDLSRLLVDAVSDAHIAGPEHIWRLDLPAHPVLVTGDEQRLHQVLANLLSNARTHTPPGSTITTGLAVSDGGPVTVTVTDDGPGIPAELLPEVFERFARGDTSRSRKAGSTGLGLAIVAAVVAAHQGTVSVTSRPGQTLFTVLLPR